jgi:hypothetical protein
VTQVKRSATTVRAQTAEERRRAQRVMLRMPVNIHVAGKVEPMQGMTHTVNANGGMVILSEGLPMGTKITVENPKTQNRVEGHVVRPPQLNAEGSLVPIEFNAAAPNFWGVFFPPAAN